MHPTGGSFLSLMSTEYIGCIVWQGCSAGRKMRFGKPGTDLFPKAPSTLIFMTVGCQHLLKGKINLSRILMLALFIAAGGCMPHIIDMPTAKEMARKWVRASRPGIEPNRQAALPRKEPRKSLTEPRIDAPTAPLRTSALPDIQEIASPQTSAAGFPPGPAEAHAITDSNDGLSAAWLAAFLLAVVAALLLVTRLIRRRSVAVLPDKPLAKLLHTRPWR